MRVSVLLGVIVVILAVFLLLYVGVVRPWHHQWGTIGSEATQALPGDNLVPGAISQVTHGITIAAPAGEIWPWLMQIGQDRSGFYSYTQLENLIGCEMPEVHYLRPDWATRTVGETVWFGTPKHFKGQARMIAAIVDAPHAFVMVSANDWQKISSGSHGTEGSWAFTLIPVDASHTRLLARMRSGPPQSFGARAAGAFFWDPMHFLMEHRMLETIKQLAENPT
jgi:hypothetical protein